VHPALTTFVINYEIKLIYRYQ